MIGLWSIVAVSALGINVRTACIGGQCSEGPLWMAPALQAFFGDFAAFCQYSRLSGLIVQYFQNTAGPPSRDIAAQCPVGQRMVSASEVPNGLTTSKGR
jgi:hypothetical protein